MSTSFVAGVDYQEAAVDASMTLTFLNGPQAISTPHGNRERLLKHNTDANTTFNIFNAAEIGVCTEPSSSQRLDSIQPIHNFIDNETCVLFDNIMASMHNNTNDDVKSPEIYNLGSNTTFNVFKSVENPLEQFQPVTSALKTSEKLKIDGHDNICNLQENTIFIMNNILGENAATKELETREQNKTFNMVRSYFVLAFYLILVIFLVKNNI